jgi:hypothetical protein
MKSMMKCDVCHYYVFELKGEISEYVNI